SGELSSTTRTSSRGSCASAIGTICGRLIASLYVGITTSARSAKSLPSPALDHRRHDEPGEHDEHAEERELLATHECARVIAELDTARARPHGDRDQRVVAAQHGCGLAIHPGVPVDIPVLRNEHI